MGAYGYADPCAACEDRLSSVGSPFCYMCDASDLEPKNACPCCGEPLYADQPWRLRNDLEAGRLETEQPCDEPYVHAWCDDRLNDTVDAEGGSR